MSEPVRYFGLTTLGRKLFGFEKAVDGRRAHWMKLPLDFFNNPTVLSLPDSQRLPLIGVGLLCMRRDNSVQFNEASVRRALNLRTAPDLNLYIEQGLIELDVASKTSDSVRGEEREEKRGEEREQTREPAYVPPALKAETAILGEKRKLDLRLMGAVSTLADRLNQDTGPVMQQVTAYKKPDGTIVKGRVNPADLSYERVEMAIADAEAWLASLPKAVNL